tara:strand:- start:31193 stop:31603 length:411 start_codon:yes stop_codon:yes gene_type:complete
MVSTNLNKRECKCGCGQWFVPTRSDKQYFNKSHADKHYGQRVRNKKQRKYYEEDKIFHRNEELLLDALNTWGRGAELAIIPLVELIAKGFKSEYYIIKTEDKNSTIFHYYSVSVCYYSNEPDGEKMALITLKEEVY